MRPRGRTPLRAALAGLALLTACGSTVPLASQGSRLEAGGGLDTAPGRTVSGSGAGPAATHNAVSAAGPTTLTVGSKSFVTSTPLAAGAPVKIGILVGVNAAAIYSAVGSSLSTGDNQAQAQAVVDYLNKHGGLAGHKVEPVFATYDATSSEPIDHQMEAACQKWTEDNHVIAAVSVLDSFDELAACLTAHGVPLLLDESIPHWSTYYAKYLVASPSHMNEDSLAWSYVDGLHQRGFFASTPTSPTRIGLLYFDSTDQHTVVNRSLNPALAQLGLRITHAEAISPFTNASSLSQESAEVQAALFHMRSNNVTHILILDEGAAIWLFAALGASNQHYYPKWGLTSYSGPGTIQADTPADENSHVTGIGFVPLFDVDVAHVPQPSSSARLCKTIMTAAGLASSSAQPIAFERGYCETLFLLQEAAAHVSHLTSSAIFRAIAPLGTSFIPTLTFATDFRRGLDGAASLRPFGFNQSCSCYVYTGPPIRRSFPPRR